MDENMRPKHFPVGGWMIVIGVIVFIIGIVSFKVTGGIEHYIDFTDVNYTENADSLKAIDLDIGAAEMEIYTSKDSKDLVFTAENFVESEYGYEFKDGVFRIYSKRNVHIYGIPMLGSGMKTTKMTLVVPEKVYEKLDLDIGAGDLRVGGISVKEADLDIGAGKFTAEGFVVDDLDLDLGAGDASYQGEINASGDIDCGTGDVDIRLAASYADYDIDFDKGVGNVDINKGSMDGTGRDIKLKIDCGVGDVDVTFA